MNTLDKYMQENADRGWFNGSVLVSQHGKVLLKAGYGMANFEFGIPNSPGMPFRIGSLSKAFTSQGILMLQEQGLLQVGEYVAHYLADFPHKEMTIEHLLAHRSGLDDSTFSLEFWQKTQRIFHTKEEGLEPQQKPLLFPSGTRTSYSNLGYMILAAIIGQCSGMSYGEYLKQQIWGPLQMEHTGCDDGRTLIKNLASGYSVHQDQVIRAEYADPSLGEGAFSLYSTIEDLYRWNQQISGYEAYAWGKGHTSILHSQRPFRYLTGDVSGFRSHMVNYEDEGLCIILLSNTSIPPVEFLAQQLARLVLGEHVELDRQAAPNGRFSNPAFDPSGVYRTDHTSTTVTRQTDEELLGKLADASPGYIANGRFFQLFEQYSINPAKTFFVLQIHQKYYIFKQIRFSWFLLKLQPVLMEEHCVEFVTAFYDGKLSLTVDGNGIKAVYCDPQRNRTEAWRSC